MSCGPNRGCFRVIRRKRWHYGNGWRGLMALRSKFFSAFFFCPFLGPSARTFIWLWNMRNWHVFTFRSLLIDLLLYSTFKNGHLNTLLQSRHLLLDVSVPKTHMTGTCPLGCHAVFGCSSWRTGDSPYVFQVPGYLKTYVTLRVRGYEGGGRYITVPLRVIPQKYQ